MEEETQKNETMEHLNETKDELEQIRKACSELKKIEICGEDCLRIATRRKKRR